MRFHFLHDWTSWDNLADDPIWGPVLRDRSRLHEAKLAEGKVNSTVFKGHQFRICSICNKVEFNEVKA